MQTLGDAITAEVIAGLILAVLVPLGIWFFRKLFRPEIRITTAIAKGPTTRELGFTEPAMKITLANVSNKDIQIKDIRLMFSKHFGASIAPEAPPGRSHSKIPASLATGAEESWYIPAQQLSNLLRSLSRPPSKAGAVPIEVPLYARCITGTNRSYKSASFSFSNDPNSLWP